VGTIHHDDAYGHAGTLMATLRGSVSLGDLDGCELKTLVGRNQEAIQLICFVFRSVSLGGDSILLLSHVLPSSTKAATIRFVYDL
jgi:hypothetical protein